MAARSIWSGSVSFGLVNVPVKLYSATNSRGVAFKQINSKTGNLVKQPKVDAVTGEKVEFADIVKGYEVSPSSFVTITPEELEAVAPKQTKMISIEEFVPAGQINPLSYDKSYYIGPADSTAGTDQAYRLLTASMRSTDAVGIGRIILRSKQQMCALGVDDSGVLVCSTLMWGDEVLDSTGQVELGDAQVEPNETYVAMATQLIESLTHDWDPAQYRDDYRDQVLAMIQRKADGELIEMVSDDTPAGPAPDLMAALAASLETVEAASEKKPAKKRASKKREVTS